MTFEPETARAFAEGHAMFPPDARVLALISGGADSTALLLLLVGDDPHAGVGGFEDGPEAVGVVHGGHPQYHAAGPARTGPA